MKFSTDERVCLYSSFSYLALLSEQLSVCSRFYPWMLIFSFLVSSENDSKKLSEQSKKETVLYFQLAHQISPQLSTLQQKQRCNTRTSSFRIAASAFAFCKFSQAVILASSLRDLKQYAELICKLHAKQFSTLQYKHFLQFSSFAKCKCNLLNSWNTKVAKDLNKKLNLNYKIS